MSKRPAFQFYPGDWLRDTALRSCSIGARGLWIDMLCLMHEGTPYGYLKVGEKVILPKTLAHMVGAPLKHVEKWLEELQGAGVYSISDENFCIFSRRMVKDEATRKKRAEGGKLGGNPALMPSEDAAKVGNKVNLTSNLAPTPSSSSSSSEQKPPNPQRGKSSSIEIKTFLAQCRASGEKPIPKDSAPIRYAQEVGLPEEFFLLAWREFVDRHRESDKRYRDWRRAFLNCLRSNWYRLWWATADGTYELTTVGVQAQRKHTETAA